MGYLRVIFGTAGAKIGDFKVEYLREFDAICKKALTRESGARWDCVMKKPEVENLVIQSLLPETLQNYYPEKRYRNPSIFWLPNIDGKPIDELWASGRIPDVKKDFWCMSIE
jgi:hypothetical protein